MTIHGGIEELVGSTPLIELRRFAEGKGLGARILAKVESFNPAGSIKDRTASSMLDAAVASGAVGPETVIIEPTSGNTGIGLAALCAARGLDLVIVMPDSMSEERRSLMRAYGAKLVLTDGALGMRGAIERAFEIAEEMPDSFIPDQFANPANPAIHASTTGPEIWRDAEGAVDVFVAGVGTGGTVTGAGSYLKSVNPGVRIVAVEPAASNVLSGGAPGRHGLQGIGAGFVPDVLDLSVVDEVVSIEDEQAFRAARSLARREGILAGVSSGAALAAAEILARRPEYEGKTIVVVLPDSGERYLSTPMFDFSAECVDEIDRRR